MGGSRAARMPYIGVGERKHVTVMFADIGGSTQAIAALDPEVAMGILDPIVQVMTKSVLRFGGVVNRIEGDGIMALFGAPVANEDHAVHACLAAQAIVAAVADLPTDLAVRVGLDSGEVVIRAVGNGPFDYDAVGITVHRAHRMEQQASAGTVFLSARTAEMARRAVDVQAMGPRCLPGLADPLPLYRLIRAHERPAWEQRAAQSPMTAFVGRQREFARLQVLLARAGLGKGQVVTLTAHAGLGKSRLVHEFLQWVPDGAWNVRSVAALSHAHGMPYRLASDILRSLLGVGPADGWAEIAAKLACCVRRYDGRMDEAPLQKLLGIHVDDLGWTDLSAGVQCDRIVAALCEVLLQRSRRTPLLLVVEDLHWCDPLSKVCLVALQSVIPNAAIMLLATSRPLIDGADCYADWMGRDNRDHRRDLHLRPLDRGSADAMLAQLLGADDAMAERRSRIVAQSGGTPLFIEELSYALIEQGAKVSEPPERSVERHAADVAVPAGVRAVLAARIDLLLPAHRRLLQVAAVIGSSVPRSVLAALADLPDAVLDSYLASLQVSEFLQKVPSADGVHYVFKDGLTHSVSYHGMLLGERDRLHQLVHMAVERGDVVRTQ